MVAVAQEGRIQVAPAQPLKITKLRRDWNSLSSQETRDVVLVNSEVALSLTPTPHPPAPAPPISLGLVGRMEEWKRT